MDGNVVLGALLAGFVCGLFPLIFGLTRGKTALAVGGMAACLVGGLILGLILALPLAILFMVLIHMQSKESRTSGAPAANP